MAGPPPPWAWRAETGYQPEDHLWLPGGVVATPAVGFMYGPALNPNVFLDMGDGPPGPVEPMQFGVAVGPAPAFVAAEPVPLLATPVQPVLPVHPLPVPVLCAAHQCGSHQCGCPGPELGYKNWRPGVNELPPEETTIIQVYWGVEEIWKDGHNIDPKTTIFHQFIADTSGTFETLLKRLMKARRGTLGCGPEDFKEWEKEWALTEWTEKGAGTWSKGSTFKLGKEGQGDKSLARCGWSAARGVTSAPVVCQLHKLPK